jgi:release factor glutamine methyltransferase
MSCVVTDGMDVTFYGLELHSEPGAVFNPRPATERLVDAALARLGDEPARIADVGSGSGAVAVSIAVHRPHVRVVATDVCWKAIRLARENALRHGVSGRVQVVQADLLDGIDGPFDLVLANLPYLPPGREADFPNEPPGAIVSTGDGLDHYRRLAAQAARVLAPDGHLLVQLDGSVHELAPEPLAA